MTNQETQESLEGEIKIEVPETIYWNSKKNPLSVGDQISGVFLRMEADEYKGKPTMRGILQVAGGDVFLPNHAVLNKALLRVQVGKTIRIVYKGTGDARKGRAAPELYDVYMSNAPAAVVSGVQMPVPAAVVNPQQEITPEIQAVLEQLRFAGKVYPDGIPEKMVFDLCKNVPAMIQALKDRGIIFPKGKGYGVAV